MANKQELCRTKAAEYLGVSPRTLKRYPIPFRQYSRFGYAIYKKSDLDEFKEKSMCRPDDSQGGVVVCA